MCPRYIPSYFYAPYQLFKRRGIPGPTPQFFFGSYNELASKEGVSRNSTYVVLHLHVVASGVLAALRNLASFSGVRACVPAYICNCLCVHVHVMLSVPPGPAYDILLSLCRGWQDWKLRRSWPLLMALFVGVFARVH